MINNITGAETDSQKIALLKECKDMLYAKKISRITRKHINELTFENLEFNSDGTFISIRFPKLEDGKDIIYTVRNTRNKIELTLVKGDNDNESK